MELLKSKYSVFFKATLRKIGLPYILTSGHIANYVTNVLKTHYSSLSANKIEQLGKAISHI